MTKRQKHFKEKNGNIDNGERFFAQHCQHCREYVKVVWGQPNYNSSMNFFISASCSRALRKRCHWLRARVRLCSG